MIRRLLLLTICLYAAPSFGQVWTYDFGTVSDSVTSGSVTSPTFLPAPSDGATAYARVGSGGGKLSVRNYTNFGTGSALRIQAPTSSSANKFDLYNMSSPSKTFGIRFTASFGDSLNNAPATPSGQFYFFAGHGSSYSGAGSFSGTQTFTGIQWSFSSGSVTMSNRAGSSWASATTPTIAYGTSIDFTFYMNGNASSVTYTGVDNVSRSLASNTWDLYMNGVYVGNLPKAQLPADSVISAFMFYGVSSTGNSGNMYIDNIVYTKNIATNPLPLRLKFFDAIPDNNSVRLFWKTEVEEGIKEYVVERSADGTSFATIGKQTGMKVNGSSYTFTDMQPYKSNYYRLKIAKEDGSYEYSQIIAAKVCKIATDMKVWYSENNLHFDKHNHPLVAVYDITGKRIIYAQLASTEYIMDVSSLVTGTYFVRIQDGKETSFLKFMK